MTERRVVWVECPFHFAPERGVVVTCPVCGQYAGFAGDGVPGRIEVTLSPRDSALLALGEAYARYRTSDDAMLSTPIGTPGRFEALVLNNRLWDQQVEPALDALRKIEEAK